VSREHDADPEPVEDLEAQERSLSSARRRLHDVIDYVRADSPAEKSPQGEQLRYLEGKERELSGKRRRLHDMIDAVRGRR